MTTTTNRTRRGYSSEGHRLRVGPWRFRGSAADEPQARRFIEEFRAEDREHPTEGRPPRYATWWDDQANAWAIYQR